MMRTNSGGGSGGDAMATPPGFRGRSQPKPAALAAAAGGAYWRNQSTGGIRYKECLKNHAISIGSYVTDGCGEFMPCGEDDSLEAFKCAVCGCHRNFHRKEDGAGNFNWNPYMVHPMMMAFDGSGGRGGGRGSAPTDPSSKEPNFYVGQSSGAAPPPKLLVAKKRRHRTKFSEEQKEKMRAFSEKLGWRFPKEADTELQRFCGELGMKPQMFKVWMYNNKNSASSAKKKMIPQNHHQHDEQQQQ